MTNIKIILLINLLIKIYINFGLNLDVEKYVYQLLLIL